jgi:hypothetical protein
MTRTASSTTPCTCPTARLHRFGSVRSWLTPTVVIQALEPQLLERLPAFRTRVSGSQISAALAQRRPLSTNGNPQSLPVAIVGATDGAILNRMFDSGEFLSEYGLARCPGPCPAPFSFRRRSDFTVDYEPGESRTGLFNSNWRGPVWFRSTI